MCAFFTEQDIIVLNSSNMAQVNKPGFPYPQFQKKSEQNSGVQSAARYPNEGATGKASMRSD